MHTMISYLIALHLYALAMLLVYRLLLRNQSAHVWSRVYLWLAAVLPFILPLLHLPQYVRQSTVYRAHIDLLLPELSLSPAAPQQAVDRTLLLYGLIAGLLLLRMAWKLYRFYRLVRHIGYRQQGPYRMVCKEGLAPGSFGCYILLPGYEVPIDIVRHEQAHIDRGHSYDMIVLELIQCLGFANLLLPLIRKELKLVHEFEADHRAATDTVAYAALLIQEGFNRRSPYTYHSFFTHPIKRRIMMLHKASTLSGIRKAGVVALLAGLCLAGMSLQSPSGVAAPAAIEADTVFRAVDIVPQAAYDWSLYLKNHLEVPDLAAGKRYRYSVYLNFIIEKDGSVSHVAVSRAGSIDPSAPVADPLAEAFKASAVKVIRNMPAWQPGYKDGKAVRCRFMVPIKFVSA